MALFVIRHAESEYNRDHSLCEKKLDAEMNLTDNGKEQALETARKLITEVNDKSYLTIFSSFFNRSFQTAEIIKNHFIKEGYREHLITLTKDPRIHEQEQGRGLINKEDLYKYNKERKNTNKYWYRFPGGESSSDCALRQKSFVDEELLPDLIEEFDVFIVGHGRQIRCLRLLIEKKDDIWFNQQENMKNGAIIKYETLNSEPVFL